MPSTRSQSWTRWRRRLAAPAMAVALLGVLLSHAAAQAPPALEVTSIMHDPRGVLEVAVTADLGATDALELTAVIDGLPRRVERDQVEEVRPVAVLLVIDTSGSMDGLWIQAARDAARALIERLPEGYRVGVVSFATEPVVESPLTANHAAALAAVDGLVAGGWTSLYDAVVTGVDQMDPVEGEDPVIVLLADGEDNRSQASADEALEYAAASDVRIYTVGIGRLFDPTYLTELSEATDARFIGLVDENDRTALTTLFARLGGQLGATTLVRIPVPPMPAGPHELVMRMRIDGETVSTRDTFTVTNDGMIRLRHRDPVEPGEPIAVEVLTLVSPELLQLTATLGEGEPEPVRGAPPAVLIDPWMHAPGPLDLRVQASAGTGPAAAADTTVEIPSLPVEVAAEQEGAELVARWRAQPGAVAEAALIAGDQVLVRSADHELTAEVPAGVEEIVVELYDAAGALVAQERAPVQPPAPLVAESSGFPYLPVVVAALAVLGLAYGLRRRRSAAPAEQKIRVRRRTAGGPAARGEDEVRAYVVLLCPDGTERRYALGARPISVGRTSDCDVVVDDEAVRAVHARISVSANGTYRVHGVGGVSARPYEQSRTDEWLVIEPRETIALGSHYLSVHPRDADGM